MLVAIGPLGFEVGTGGAATFEYVKDRGNKGYPFAFYDSSKRVADTIVGRTPVENLEHIRAVLSPTVTDMAELLRVSRQAIYDWQAGKPVAPESALRLWDLAQAAAVFAVEGLRGSSQALHRPIRKGKNFFELVGEGDSAESAARMLAEIVRSESRQRQALKNRLAGRKRPTREAFEEIGAPMLDERS
jgi:transcriptional regulator with XRE-family HTH domain